MSVPHRPERAALSRELGDFLIELSIALHKHAMYPQGHPSLAPAAAAVTRRGETLLEERSTLSLGVARQQLVIEGVATDPHHPVLAELAGRLHRHHLGAVTFHRGVRAAEVGDVLRTLAVEAERSGEPLGLGPPGRLSAWEHVRLHPLTYERLELVDETPEAGTKGTDPRSAQLWLGLARAALAAESLPEDAPPPTEPVTIARAIDKQPKSAAYDQVIVGYLLQIADELKGAGGADAAALRRRTSKLIGALEPGTLRRLIEMGGDAAQRHQFALDATQGLAVDAVLEIVRAMADASHRAVSDPLVRMLSKLAVHAEQGTAAARSQADGALRDQVRRLLTGWTLEDPNPQSYSAALQGLTRAAPRAATGSAAEARIVGDPVRLLQIALELGAGGPAVQRAVAHLLQSGRLGDVVTLLEQAPPPPVAGAGLALELWPIVTAPEAVRQVVGAVPPDFATLDRLLPRLAVPAFTPLLDLLAHSESRAVRRGLLDRLARAPADLGPLVAGRLARDAPWYVLRNLLTVLDALPRLPDGFSPAAFAAHDDPRVRRIALKLTLKVPPERERALLRALGDPEPRIVQLGLTAALDGCSPAVVPVVAAVARDEEEARTLEVRGLAIRVLGRARAPLAVATLLGLTSGGRTLLGRRRLAPKSPILVAALMALAHTHTRDHRARAILALAAASRDPDIRSAADPDAEAHSV